MEMIKKQKNFSEVWQYGSDLGRTDGVAPEPLTFQDGVAAQCDIPNINNRGIIKTGGRVYIPSSEPKGFVTSHSSENYKWIFEKLTDPVKNPGYVKPRK
jgi:hypothetical protein